MSVREDRRRVQVFPDPQQLQMAMDAIAQFEASPVPGVWLGLDREQVISEMRSRLQNPFSLSQGGQPFCGPAVIIFELIRHHPQQYVKICRNLFQLGGFHTLKNTWISASERLRNTHGNFLMPQADWMLLSTLRESQNLWLPIEPNAPDILRNLAGITKPWEIVGWTQELLGFADVNFTKPYLFGHLQAMENATAVLDQGGVVLALINAEALLKNKPPLIPYPSHWVAVVSAMDFTDTNSPQLIDFQVYSWGQKMRVTATPQAFSLHFWEAITAQPL
ncbi:MAG: hypothetical protein P5683_10440 [Limnospira sp. PMC 1279.21]|uniref:hypothetical protein n=1 Tax=unclassified Limnospira TaxID=2642885 RepID=UPI0028E13885|nr:MULTISPECIES: hypothetical protein [unclassified Limnospira]MDT9188047.1 hypothetical protein [Limnospira sp. PMC 894.15]MDT9285093.1 hypothetical protein [Limnospira sp. PMC 1298.21]MDT9315832.1 hypothetical protein [Limnospira sp. PMC 1306.21]MDT9177877.1 hypothetical protein [Limnospira sp. PMC 1238.20]MDT9203371.1 hypothetical protein [Limnospira sp. PMC 1243.20]